MFHKPTKKEKLLNRLVGVSMILLTDFLCHEFSLLTVWTNYIPFYWWGQYFELLK